jgi:hypothetical protein
MTERTRRIVLWVIIGAILIAFIGIDLLYMLGH